MRLPHLLVAFVLAAALPFAPANAQSDPGIIGQGDWTGPLEIRFPEPAYAGIPVHAIVPGDGCFQNGRSRIDPERTVVARTGSTITVDLYATTPICFSAGDPLTVFIHHQPLGSYPAGTYQVVARYHYIENPGAPPFATLSAPLTVAGTAPSVLDAHSPWSLGLLALALLAVGAGTRRLRPR